MADFEREKNILLQITKARDAIRRKHQLLKQGQAQFDKSMSETFKPVVDPLQKLVSLANKQDADIETNSTYLEKDKKIDDSSSESSVSNPFNETESSNDTLRAHDTTFESAGEITNDDSFDASDISDPITNKYISLLRSKQNPLIDKIFGVREEGNSLMIGDSIIVFDGDKVSAKGKTYQKTKGLMELLFKKQPSSSLISKQDLKSYIQIIEDTNAHKKKHQSDGSYRNMNTNKFKFFISPNLTQKLGKRRSVEGTGLTSDYKIARIGTSMDYVYWDDPNELVDRLRLLVAEKAAGNPSHVNEIQSIIEELREAGYIY